MTPYKQGDVVLVSFPFTDLSTSKQRPAVVVSADWFNRSRLDCVLAAITSQVPATLARDELLLTAADLSSAGLPKSSIIRCGKIVTLQQALVRKRLGELQPTTLHAALDSVRSVMSTR